jgi:rhamnulose-1-phosphate aldolase
MNSLVLSDSARHHLADVAVVAGFLWERGWAVKNGGNISVDLTGEVNIPSDDVSQSPFHPLDNTFSELARMVLLVTGAGTRMRDVENDIFNNVCLLRFSEDGSGYHVIVNAAFNARRSPTSELATHLAIHQMLKQKGGRQKAVLHTHPEELIAMTLIPGFTDEARLNKMLLSVQPEAALTNPRGIGLVPYILPGTQQLAEKTVGSLQHHELVLWGKHGCISCGADIQEAFDLIDVMNKSARLFFQCRNAGYTPQGLTDQEIEQLRKLF